MMNEKQWSDLMVEHEIAYLRGDLATSSPESYTIEEMKKISEGMDASTAEVEAAMRADFAVLAPAAQAAMLNLLQQADPASFAWWIDVLVGKAPDHLGEISPQDSRPAKR